MFRFETLDIWLESRELAKKIYKITSNWPKTETFGLTSQVRRCVVSVAANIAEGSASSSKKDFRNFLDHSRKSLFETVSHLYVALDQGYISESHHKELYGDCETLIRRISAFKKSLR